MDTLSVFIDESGDFGTVKENPSYYPVTLVFHDQKININIVRIKNPADGGKLVYRQVNAARFSAHGVLGVIDTSSK